VSKDDIERIACEIHQDILVLKEKMIFMEKRIAALNSTLQTLKTTAKEWR
tara:strand:+ start:98 stop:247 length:150 start_codon:yes stop_codon:yes gene_type:complete